MSSYYTLATKQFSCSTRQFELNVCWETLYAIFFKKCQFSLRSSEVPQNFQFYSGWNEKRNLWGHLEVCSITPVIVSWVSPVSESIEWRDWQTEGPTSGWGSLWESSSFVPWFSTFMFRNVPGTVSECVRICWFKRNSSNLDRAPKMRDSVLLNSWDSFLLTLPSISSETCVIYSSLILGTDVFRDWPLLGFSSCVSLATAANFRLFLNVAIFLKGKCYAVLKTELFCIC